MTRLVVVSGERAGQTFELSRSEMTIGRHRTCDVVLSDGLVSGQHARLRREQGAWTLTDLESSNGTLVNDQPVQSVRLTDGDRIQIGEEVFVFRTDASPEGRAPATPEASEAELAMVRQMQQRAEAIRREVGKVIVGQREVVDQILMVLLAGGHGLLIGLPGMAKTLMVRTIAQALDLKFKRIQFTPDLMPSDITGTEVLETNRDTLEKEFRFLPGPLFTHLLLADEINRTPPKTQAALLEAMQEKRVTVGNKTYALEEPFFVLATQNPIEQEGTYPLPEAQMDRFMFFIWVDYPSEPEEEIILDTTTVDRPPDVEKVLAREEVLQLQQVVRKIPVSPHVVKYTTRLVRSSRPGDPRAPEFVRQYVSTGAGPRAGQYLILAAKARAVLEGRIHVSCADIRRAALPVLRHRLYTNFTADSEGVTATQLIERLLQSVEEPAPADYAGQP